MIGVQFRKDCAPKNTFSGQKNNGTVPEKCVRVTTIRNRHSYYLLYYFEHIFTVNIGRYYRGFVVYIVHFKIL